MNRGVQLGFVTILLFLLPCTVRRLRVKSAAATVPGQARGYEKFRLTLLFKAISDEKHREMKLTYAK